MRKPRFGPFAFGIVVLGVLWLVGIGLPHTEGYPSLFHWLRDRMTASSEARFDRDKLRDDLVAAGFRLGDPAHIRIFKAEKRLELWLAGGDGRFALLCGYDICKFSGGLGPKLREGDLKQGFDLFELTATPPAVAACKGEYRFGEDAGGPDCVPIAAWS